MPEPAAAASTEEEPKWDGSLRMQYRGRSGGRHEDHDLHQNLALNYRANEPKGLSFQLFGRLSADLDGRANAATPFADLNDTYEAALQGRLYSARARLREDGALERVDLGRMRLIETPEFTWFDGMLVESRVLDERQTKLGAYGGVPVHAYESTSQGDRLFGTWLATRPWQQAHLRVDWLYLEDDLRFSQPKNHLFAASLQQNLGANASAVLTHSRVGGEARDARIDLSWLPMEYGFVLRGSYYRLLEAQGQLALELDPYSTPLHVLEPYHEARLALSKNFGNSLHVEVGAQSRRLQELADIGQFNRDYDRVYWTNTLPELLPLELSLQLSADWWDGEESNANSLGFELDRNFDEEYEAALGSYFSLYRYDWLEDVERVRVRTWYLRLAHTPKGALAHELRYELDDDAVDSYHSLRWTSTWSF